LKIPIKNRHDGQAKAAKLTPMESAFLAGLVDLAQRETDDAAIALPTGVVEPGELRQAIVALTCAAKGERGDAE
jgi:hypothetical protein